MLLYMKWPLGAACLTTGSRASNATEPKGVTSAAVDKKLRVMVDHIDDEERLLCGISWRGRVRCSS
jgi:hypothetical protein